MRIALLAGVLTAWIGSALAGEPVQRTLTFDERVAAQAAIERVYYGHQLQATLPFEQAVPRAVIESKVQLYLEQTAALQAFWKTTLTDDMLQHELERMATGSRMPERLRELYAALGNDPFLIKECLVRATLVDRLAHNFYALDPSFHVAERKRAEDLRGRLLSGALAPSTEVPERTPVDLVVDPTLSDKPSPVHLSQAAFADARAEYPKVVGEVSAIDEQRESFLFSVVLNESPSELHAASYVIPKTPWSTWWDTARRELDAASVAAVASTEDLPAPRFAAGGLPCVADGTWDNGSFDDVPDARQGYTAVWTGSVMIVWGGLWGRDESTDVTLNTGGRYDPATDSWRETSTAGAPSPRYQHSAVWTGSVMVVWGGFGAFPFSNTGGRYDPISDSWTPTSTVGAPTRRFGHAAVWTGSRMLIWGSETGGGRYDPVTDTWTSMSTLGAPRPATAPELSLLWTGHVMVVGGGFFSFSDNGGRYDPIADTWAPMSATGAPATGSAVWTGTRVAVWGGRQDNQFLNTGALYDPVNNSWTPMSSLGAPSGRQFHTAVWTGNSMMIWGGSTGGGWVNTGGRYDPVTEIWTTVSTVGAPTARVFATGIWTGSTALIWGGQSASPFTTNQNTGGRYDPSTDSWTPTSTGPAPDKPLAQLLWTGSSLLLWDPFNGPPEGGRYDPATDSWRSMSMAGATGGTGVWSGQALLNRTARYDPIADTWSPISSVGAPPNGYTVWAGNRLVVWSGASGGRYDPATDTWASTSTVGAPAPRSSATVVSTGSEMILWGGAAPNFSPLNTGGRYNPASDTWTPTSSNAVPAPRFNHSAVWTGSEMIIFAGSQTPLFAPVILGSGGRYDPVTDTWKPTAPGSARGQHSAVWTGSEMIIWGGDQDLQNTNGGSRYNPVTDSWTNTSLINAPAPRKQHSAVWTGSMMVIWGGTRTGGGRYVLGAAVDNDGDGYTECQGDCNDTNPNLNPGAIETCNGVDDNCDGVIDDSGAALCDDGNACTDDTCSGVSGCAHSNNTGSCSDGNACTTVDICDAGTCVGTTPLVCTANDQCHVAGACDEATGLCSNPNRPDGTVCDDQSLCTTGETCQAGICTPAFSGLDQPNPRTNGYYMRLCRGPHSGDQLVDADATCVAGITATFASISTVADICAVIEPSHPNGDACGRTDDDLMVLALNVCRARVCTAQSIDSACGANENVGSSFDEADALLSSASRNAETCRQAQCMTEEINTGEALELNSLALAREGGSVRLTWSPPYMNDGEGVPDRYRVWRRAAGSLVPMVIVGEPALPTFLDTTAGTGAFEYDVTAVVE